ncbi:esterase-like activity of phytase family protein [Mumia qirimensis]|uniref:esterase-like activity of phytase family protein n=1 Tax=Mumia qirimensis TaxID=3234852 RepID=UPI00351D9EFD
MSRTLRHAAGGLTAAALIAAVVPAAVASSTPSAAGAPAAQTTAFHRTATFPVYRNLPADVPTGSETVAEISDVSADGKTLVYTDALGKRIGFVDISDPSDPRPDGTLSLAQLGGVDDQPTSVAVVGPYVLVVVDTSASFTDPSGRLDVVRLSSGKRIRSIDLEGQPDSIAVNADESVAAVAIENQRDEEATPPGGDEGDLPQLPAGFVQVLDLDGAPGDWTTDRVDLVNPDGSALPEMVAAGVTEPTDPEPEYVSINRRDELAVTLQENNAVALIDLDSRALTSVFSAGSVTVEGVDATKDGAIRPSDTITDVPREPDAIGWIDDEHLATANEGDWLGGSRGWTIFSTDGDVVWDAGNTFERTAIRHGLANEDRAAKKGAEPEGLSVATFDGTPYAFVGSERSNFVAVYDVSDPAKPVQRQVLPTTNGPEGLLPIPGRDLLVVSSETDASAAGVRASVSLFELGKGAARFPSIVSTDTAGAPIGWTALGALSADPTNADRLWTASDAALKTASLYAVDVSASPARITRAVPVTDAGAPAALDVEGLFARPQGGFWLASEGATGPQNALVRTDSAGAVQERVALPADVSAHVGKWGLEGVTATNDKAGEHVWVALQRPLWTDPSSTESTVDGDDVARIGRYDLADASWHWYAYPLATPRRGGVDWIGLSEITAVDGDTLAVIERDKLNGPDARVKRVYTVDVPAKAAAGGLTTLDKRLAYDVLPDLRATNGWTQEKLEGLTIGRDGQVYAVTDNDGLKDATGETVFLRLGAANQVFARELATRTRLASTSRASYGSVVRATVTVTGGSGIALDGRVTLRDGNRVVGSAALASGTARIDVRGLRPGSHRLVATYGGGTLSAPSTSGVVPVVVARAAARATLAVGRTQLKPGKRVAVTVRLDRAGQGAATVRILDGRRTIKTVTLRGSTARTTLHLKGRGQHRLKVVFAGSSFDAPATSRTVTVRVRR